MEQYFINPAEHIIDERLKGFVISQKQSSAVDYYGSNAEGTVFIQYKNNVAYLYRNVAKEDIEAMNQADGIGRYMSVLARKGYQFEKIKEQLVKSKSQEENVEE